MEYLKGGKTRKNKSKSRKNKKGGGPNKSKSRSSISNTTSAAQKVYPYENMGIGSRIKLGQKDRNELSYLNMAQESLAKNARESLSYDRKMKEKNLLKKAKQKMKDKITYDRIIELIKKKGEGFVSQHDLNFKERYESNM
jgi:hypothetical protein